MQEQDKKTNRISETVALVAKLQKEVFDVCETLDGHAEVIGKDMFDAMLKHHYEQYMREFELMNAEKLTNVDKMLAELKIHRIKELAEIEKKKIETQNELDALREQQEREFELEKEKIVAEFKIVRVKELGEIELEHEKAKAEIERRRTELEIDVQIAERTLERELLKKMEKVTPGIKVRRRFLGIPIGRLRYNQAMELALEAAEFSAFEYLMSRAQEIAVRKAEYLEKIGSNEEKPDEDQEQSEEMTEPVFVPEPMTEWEKKYYLKELEKQDYRKFKERRRAEKAERKRLKKEARQANKLNKKEARQHEVQSEPEEAPASNVQVKIDADDKTE